MDYGRSESSYYSSTIQVSVTYRPKWIVSLQMKMDNKYFTIGTMTGGGLYGQNTDTLGFSGYTETGHFNGHTLTVNNRYAGYDYTYPGTFDGQNAYNGWSYREKAK